MGKTKYLIFLFIAIMLSGCMGTKKSDIIIVYNHTGGLIGFNDHLTIDHEGNAVLKRKNSQVAFKLNAETLKHLETSLNEAAFTKLNKSYRPLQQGNDLIEYTVTYNGYTVQLTDTAVPEIMQPILESLNQIVENAGK
jgi:hypothetical protein